MTATETINPAGSEHKQVTMKQDIKSRTIPLLITDQTNPSPRRPPTPTPPCGVAPRTFGPGCYVPSPAGRDRSNFISPAKYRQSRTVRVYMYMTNISHLPPAYTWSLLSKGNQSIYELSFLPEADREHIETGPRYTVGPAPEPPSVFVTSAAWYMYG